MKELLYDPWLVGVMSQIIGGVIAGLIVHIITNRPQLTDQEICELFPGVRIPKIKRFRLNWRYIIFYGVMLSGTVGITLLQDPSLFDWYQISIYLLYIAWWSMVALNIFTLMDGASTRRILPNPILFLIGIIIPFIGHSKSVVYTAFALLTKAGVVLLAYGVSNRLSNVNNYQLVSGLMAILASVDVFFYAYLFLPRYAEFWNWRDGQFIISDFKWLDDFLH